MLYEVITVFSDKSKRYFIEKNDYIRDLPKNGAYIEDKEPVVTLIRNNFV